MRRWSSFLLTFFILLKATAQQDSAGIDFTFNGYLKDLNTIALPLAGQKTQYTQLVHNRLNLKWTADQFNASLEFRNRFFWGDMPRQDPMLAKHLENINEKINIPVVWFSNRNSMLHSNLERAWMEIKRNPWRIRMGRQRINWGMNNNWNPNDIFNAYNLLDFDYEERAGVDGLCIGRTLEEMGTLEWAAAFHREGGMTSAIKYAFNRHGLDGQLLMGAYRSRFTMGAGWQGSFGNWGLKGELQFFGPRKDQRALVNASVEIDRITKGNGYLYGSILFSQAGLTKPPLRWENISFQNSPIQLMPTRWNLLASYRKEFGSGWHAAIGLIHAPLASLWILYPSVSYSVRTNVDLDLFWQSFWGKSNGAFGIRGQTGFLRLKWSF